jgi:hypothetical protein
MRHGGAAYLHRRVDGSDLTPTVDFRSHRIGGRAHASFDGHGVSGIKDNLASERRVASAKTAPSARYKALDILTFVIPGWADQVGQQPTWSAQIRNLEIPGLRYRTPSATSAKRLRGE